MIRIRDAGGRLIEPERPIATVELCSTDGKVARLLLVAGPRILILSPKDPELRAFCQAAGLEIADEITVAQ